MDNETFQFAIVAFICTCGLLPVPFIFALLANILEKYQDMDE